MLPEHHTHRCWHGCLAAAMLVCLLSWLSPLQAQTLPAEVQAALNRAKVPADALSIWVAEALPPDQTPAPPPPPRLSHRASAAMNPASVMKLVTTYAALDMLGPAYTWRTPLYLDGPVNKGTLQGTLYIRGQGDPKLVLERLWLLLRRVQGVGIHHIAGDIVLDNSAFEPSDSDPAQFDGEPLRPYNAAPDALLLNYKAVVMTFTPGLAAGVAQVQFDPPLAAVQLQTTVPLSSATDCGDYRSSLKADFSDPRRIRFAGSYPPGCGEKVWPVAYADPASYAVRAVQGLWQEMGGKLGGTVRMGSVPDTLRAAKPALEVSSAPLAEVVRDINKYSNNVMAQQLFLTLGNGSFAAARARVLRWWQERIGQGDSPVLDNGSGLSRQERISAQGLGQLLLNAYASPLMPELMASLPIAGVDGTLRRAATGSRGSAHLKTGSLSNVIALAGYVHAASGKRYVLVAMVNHPQASAARPAMEALVDWTLQDR